jgi:hypothetical protein
MSHKKPYPPAMMAHPYWGKRWRANQEKNKRQKLQALLEYRGIPGKVFYIRQRFRVGWFYQQSPEWEHLDLLGETYFGAKEMIELGTLDFFVKEIKMAENKRTALEILEEFAMDDDVPMPDVKSLLEQFIIEVQKVHVPVCGEAYPEDPNRYCDACMTRDGGSPKYPCKTIRLVRKYLYGKKGKHG